MRTRKWPESFFIFVYRGRIPSGSKAELARILLDFPSRFFLSPSFRVSVSLSIPVIYFRRPSPSGKPFSHPRYPDPHNHWRLIRSGGQAVACREWKRGLKPGLSAIVFFCKYPTPARNLSPRYHRFSNFTNVPKARPFEE